MGSCWRNYEKINIENIYFGRCAGVKVITGDLAKEITALKKQIGKDLIAHGGIEFAQNLVQTGLVDEFCIAMHPVAAGRGSSLFEKLSPCTSS